MPLFPDEFPFKKPATPASDFAPPPAPVEEPAPAAIEAAIVEAAGVEPAPVQQVVVEPPAPVLQGVPVVAQQDEETILPPPAAAPIQIPSERRRSPRQALLARALIKMEIGTAPGWKIDLLNVSMLGIRFRSPHSLTPGDKAFVKLEVGPLKWNTKLRVIHCNAMESGEYSIGCEFVGTDLARTSARAAA
jgi:hypothetical protein